MRAPGEQQTNYIKQLFLITGLIYIIIHFIITDYALLSTVVLFNKKDYLHVINEEQKRIFQLNIKEVITGTLLGDGTIVNPKKGNVYFKYKQSVIHIDYFFFIYFILEPWCTKGSPFNSLYLDKRYEKHYRSLTLITRTAPLDKDELDLNYFYNLFYVSKIKKIPSNIYTLLTPISLAI